MRTRTLPVVTVAILAAWPARAGDVVTIIEPGPNRSPTHGVLLPGAPLAGTADATSVEMNPGQIPFLDGTTTAVIANHWADGDARPGRGTALLLGTPLVLLGQPLASSLGLGLHWLRPSGPGLPRDYLKLRVGSGFRLSRSLGLGVAWDHIFRSRYAGLDSFTVGAGARLTNSIAVGLAVRDVFRPRAGEGFPLSRLWDVEVALRLPRSHRFELGVGARFDDREAALHGIWPHARLFARVARGVALYADVGREGLGDADTARVRAAIGVTASLDHLDVSLAGLASASGGSGSGLGPGGSVALSSIYVRQPALVSSKYIARLKLAGLGDDYAFVDTVVRLRCLAEDDAVAAVLLDLQGVGLGLGRLEELRELVARLRRHKPVYAYVAYPSTGEYYLAAACDRIALHPAGQLGLSGLSQTITFFKGAMENLGVHMDLVRIAEFKGAMEPFVMSEASEPVRENRDKLLDDDFARIVAAIARDRGTRGLDDAKVRRAIDEGSHGAAAARAAKLIDGVADEEDIEAFVRDALGRKLPVRDADLTPFARPWWKPGRVAVVMVDGAITDGAGPTSPLPQTGVSWSDAVIGALADVRGDSSIKAVVLRVNSPGGSAYASDRIAREVARLRKAGKPVVVSMADVAASGGYYVAAPADVVYADPSTVTGSIGIFSYKLDVKDLMDKVGLAHETSKRGERADQHSLYRPWTDGEREAARERITGIYGLFLDTVARGRSSRGITRERANELGRGRVYTGAEALGLGLVDRLGGLDAAIDDAAARAGVPLGRGGLPELVVMPRKPASGLRALIGIEAGAGSATGVTSLAVEAALRLARPAVRLLLPLLLEGGSGVQARLPYDIEIK